MAQFVGKTERVIIDRQDGDYWIGRTQYDSPEVDCEVLIEKLRVESLEFREVEELKVGEFYDVEITKAEEFDLYGKIIP